MDESDVLWLRIYVDAASGVSFFVSDDDGVSWHQMTKATGPPHVWSGFFATDMEIGPFASATAHVGAVNAKFDYFLINKLHEVGEFMITEECISFQDVRSPDRVYAGRIKSLSPLKRALDDKTGLYKIADLSMVLANNDGYYSRRITDGILKNQEVNVYHAWTEDPEVNRVLLMKMFIEDYSLKGNEFHVKMKDATQKYFSKKIPANICTVEDYPRIHPDHVGRVMPEALGVCVVGVEYEKPGAIEAVHVDIAGGGTRDYLAARGALRSATDNANFQVYEDGVPVVATMMVHTDGHSYINYDPIDHDAMVTFNCYGYSVPAWDTGINCIQNLVYITEYLLHYLMEMPLSLIDQASFDALATFFNAQGWGTNGFLILQRREDAMEILRQLLFTGEIKGYVAKGGDFVVDIKDVFNYEITHTDSHLFTQTDLLRAPDRQWNLTKAINTVNSRFGYIPWQQLWLGAENDYKENFYDAEMEEDVRIREDYLPV
jgi:hypothetical protein